MQNKFTKFAIKYFDFLSINAKAINYIASKIKNQKKSFFNKDESIDSLLQSELSGYNDIITDRSLLEQGMKSNFNYLMIKEFAEFIVDMEYVFMYNTEALSINAIRDDISCETILSIENDNFTTKYTFKDSAINMPAESDLLSFINDTHSEISNVIFTTVTIYREFGNNKVSEFKFINSDYQKSANDELDMTMLDVVNNTTENVIIKILNDILDNCIPKYVTDLNLEIPLEKLLYGKLDIWG